MTTPETPRERCRRIMCDAMAQVLREMGVDPTTLDDPIETAFDEEATDEECAVMDALPDAELSALCRQMAIAHAPPEFKRRLPS